MSTLKRLSLTVAALVCGLGAAGAADEDATAAFNWAHPNEVVVRLEEMSFTSADLPSTKNESLYVWAYSPEGSLVCFCLFHIDSAIANRWGVYVLVVDPSGEVHWYSDRLPARSVRHSEDRLEVNNGRLSFFALDNGHRLIVNSDSIGIDLCLESILPAWKAGTGRFNYTDDGELYQSRIQVCPWARVSGTVRTGADSFFMEGHGSVEKTRFSNPVTRMPPRVRNMRLFGEGHCLYLHDVVLSDVYGGYTVPALGFASGSRWLFTCCEFEAEVVHWGTAGHQRFEYPRVIRLDASASGYTFRGEYSETRQIGITDMLAELPSLAASILGAVFEHPIYVRSIGTFTGTVTTPDDEVFQVELSGPFEYASMR